MLAAGFLFQRFEKKFYCQNILKADMGTTK